MTYIAFMDKVIEALNQYTEKNGHPPKKINIIINAATYYNIREKTYINLPAFPTHKHINYINLFGIHTTLNIKS